MIPGYFGTSGPQCSHQRKIIVYSWSTINACSLLSHEYWVPLIKFMVGPFIWEEGVRIYGISGVPNNFPPSKHPISLITIRMPLLSITLFSYLNQPPKPTHIHTLSPSISLSLTGKPAMHHHQWRSQKFRLGGARLKDKIENKKLI